MPTADALGLIYKFSLPNFTNILLSRFSRNFAGFFNLQHLLYPIQPSANSVNIAEYQSSQYSPGALL
jgi:hypothetical protein